MNKNNGPQIPFEEILVRKSLDSIDEFDSNPLITPIKSAGLKLDESSEKVGMSSKVGWKMVDLK